MTSADNNPVGFLQEICQKYGCMFPQYEVINFSGPDHCRQFTYKCSFEGFQVQGMSRQKKQAKSEAAKEMVAVLRENGYFDKLNLKHGNSINHTIESEPLLESNITESESKNPISALNEFCQKKLSAPPQFVETSAAGTFVCECKLGDKKTYGHGPNKKSAKTEAALKMCYELKIKCNLFVELLQESEMEGFQTEKNPVSALQELCAQNTSMKQPEYIELSTEKNLFVVKCTLGAISCEGRGTSKKIAKTQAANQVLAKLSAQRESAFNGNGEGVVIVNKSPSKLTRVLSTSSESNAVPSTSLSGVLQDFNVDDDDKEDNQQEPSPELKDVVNLKIGLEKLKIDECELDVIQKEPEGETIPAQEGSVEGSSLS